MKVLACVMTVLTKKFTVLSRAKVVTVLEKPAATLIMVDQKRAGPIESTLGGKSLQALLGHLTTS